MPLPITEKDKLSLTYQIFSLYAEHGFEGISMDEIAKQINLSKATIYKYFKSKEDIVREIVNERIAHLNALQFKADNNFEEILTSLSAIYFEGVVTGAYTSSKFITDLESKFPNILSDYIIALNITMKRFASFFENAIREGYCKQVSIELIGAQAKMMLPTIIKADFLDGEHFTLTTVLKEYYKLLLCQMLNVEYMDAIDKDSTYLFVDELVEFLKSRYLIGLKQL